MLQTILQCVLSRAVSASSSNQLQKKNKIMKTNIFKYALIMASMTVAFGSCIEETFPESGTATADQVGESSAALEGSVNGMSSKLTQGYLVYGGQTHETDMAYPQFMIAATEMLGDMYPGGSNSGYDWYRNYNCFNRSHGSNSYFAYLPWFTCYQFVKSANDIIASVDLETAGEIQKEYAGMAYANRAFYYWLLTTLFEPIENKYTDVSKVKGLTVCIVDENTTGEISKNNPRVTHDEITAFMLKDLDTAEELLANYVAKNHLQPDLAVVYGLKARVYMWDEDYANAYKYADLAIQTAERNGAKNMTEDEWTNPKSGFTTATSGWMWYCNYAAEMMGNLCNFVGWMSGEADWGYSSLTFPMIDKNLYDKIGASDFRKNVFLHPDKYNYYSYKTVRDKSYIEDAPAYLALKFRCREGNWEDYAVGGAIDVPIMRLEEMYLLRAEAAGMSQGFEKGKQLLQEWVNAYRDSKYTCGAIDQRTMQLAVLDQMRIELWGEFNAFPSAKRIKPGFMQNYEGTNAPEDMFKINCEGIKPVFNLCIPDYELDSNKGITKDLNNPDPTQAVVGPATPGVYQ